MSDEKTSTRNNLSTPYGIGEERFKAILHSLHHDEDQKLAELTSSLPAADIVHLMSSLPTDERRKLLKRVIRYLDPTIITTSNDVLKEEILALLGTRGISRAVRELNSDDAFSLFQSLDPVQQTAILKALPAKERSFFEQGLTYPEDSAGRLMQREVFCIPNFWTVAEVLSFVRNTKALPKTFYDIFVVDPRHHPIGFVPLSELLRHDQDAAITDIMITPVKTISTRMDREEVAFFFRHYGLVSCPVVNENNRVVGMITVDDVVEIINEEAQEDFMYLAGVSEKDFLAPVLKTFFMRSRWLIITLISTLLSASVIHRFEDAIIKKSTLSSLMVIVAAMGGIAGMQTVTVTVRAIATRVLNQKNASRAIVKELSVSLITGIFFSTILGTIAAIWLQDIEIGLVLSAAMFCNILWAGFAGVCLTIFVERLGMDPAISAGPLLTTTTDALGYALFLGFAAYFLLN